MLMWRLMNQLSLFCLSSFSVILSWVILSFRVMCCESVFVCAWEKRLDSAPELFSCCEENSFLHPHLLELAAIRSISVPPQRFSPLCLRVSFWIKNGTEVAVVAMCQKKVFAGIGG